MKRKKKKKSGKLTSRALQIVHENGFPKVINVIDADEPFEGEVTANDIAMGTRKEHRVCPFATCAKRTLHCPVIISRSVSYAIINPTTAVRYQNSMALQTQIKVYDQGGEFEPGWYGLIPYAASHRIGAKHYGSGTSGTSGTSKKARRRRHFSANVRTVLGAYKPAEVLK
jgi:hypothetical protein